MRIPQKATDNLMDALAIIAINAKGLPQNDNEMEEISSYAKQKFISIMTEWEELMGEEWNVIPENI